MVSAGGQARAQAEIPAHDAPYDPRSPLKVPGYLPCAAEGPPGKAMCGGDRQRHPGRCPYMKHH